MRILVVEDDPQIAGHLVRGLKQRGYTVDLATDGVGLGGRLLAEEPDCVVLDLMLPTVDGLTALADIRRVSAVPVIVLTAKNALDDRLRSFEAGATDFMAKPYFLEELVARVELRVGRRRAKAQVVTFGPAQLDLDARLARVAGEDVGLTRHEFDVLAYLVRRAGRAVSRATLCEGTLSKAGDADRSDRIIDVHISRIRQKLGPEAARHLATVRGLGYRFDQVPRR